MVRAPRRVLPRSLAPSGVLTGGRSGPGSPLLGLGLWGWRPQGGCLPLLPGASEVRRSPSPDCPASGRAVGVRYPRAVGAGVWVWGPNTVPLACTLCGGCVPRRWWGAVPLPGLGPCAPLGAGLWRSCAGGRAWGGGAARAPRPPFVRLGGPVGRGVSLLCSVPLPSLGRQQSGCHWRRSGHGGRGPHTTPVRAHPSSLGAICAASWRVGAGSLVPRGSCGSRRLGRGGGPCSGSSLGRGEARPSLLPRGVGAGDPAACGPFGGVGGGGGSRRGLPAPSLGGGLRFPTLAPLLSSAHSPPACAFGWGRGAAPEGRGMRGDPWTAPPGAPSDLNPPSALPEWAMVMGGVNGGRGLHTVLVRSRAPSPGLVRTPLRRAGVGSPVGRDLRGSRRLGAPGRAVCRSSRIPPRRAAVPSGGGGRPLGSGWAEGRSCGPQAGGGSGGGGGVGGAAPPPPAPPPRRASACHQLSPACPSGVYSCRGGCRAAAGVGRGAVGRQWVSAAGGGGEGGGNPPPWFAPPSSPNRPPKGLLRVCRPGRRRSAVGRQRAGRERAGGSPGALAAAAVPPHPGCSGLFGGDAGPPSFRSASARSSA